MRAGRARRVDFKVSATWTHEGLTTEIIFFTTTMTLWSKGVLSFSSLPDRLELVVWFHKILVWRKGL